ncbi:MAG: glutamine synthetase [Deltaproteobacteria bacterium]|nr:glutamine synthetase [Deltaproteobacteria bacterium]
MTDSMFNYALTNPISKMLDKDRYDFTRKDLLRVIEERQIERIGFHYTALDGKLKELKIPLSDRRQVETILAEGERVDGSSLFKGMVDSSMSDLYVVPLYRSAFLNPFDSGSIDFICRYITKDGEPAAYAPDTILSKANALFQERTGLELHMMGELEFFLISENKQQIYQANRQHGYHAAAPFIKSGHILNEMIRHIVQTSGNVKYAHSEVGYIDSIRSDLPEIRGKCGEQLEIEYLPRPVEEAADNLVLGRWLIRNIAYQRGCVATFAPKIEESVAGNGLHFHMALMKGDKNVMNKESGGLSDQARKLVGGLCKYAETLTAFGNTVSSAYLRLVPNQEAPTRICWSDLNRSAMVRVPLGWARLENLASEINPQEKERFQHDRDRQTIELRSPDGSASVHLLMAGIAMAAEWGLGSPDSLKIAEDLYVTGNVFKEESLLNKLPALPVSCVDSSRLLLKQRELYEREDIFPKGMIDYIVELLSAENDENMNSKLADLPADDRLHATRKIMHRCLHEQ